MIRRIAITSFVIFALASCGSPAATNATVTTGRSTAAVVATATAMPPLPTGALLTATRLPATVAPSQTLVPTTAPPKTSVPTMAASATSVPTSVPTATPAPAVPTNVPTAVPSATPAPAPPTSVPTVAATLAPTVAPTNTPLAATPEPRTITIAAPVANAEISAGTLTVRGVSSFWPFEATLGMRLLGSNGETLAVGPAMVEGGYPTGTDDGGGPFQGTLSFAAPTTRQPATLEVFEESMKDGSIVTSVRVPVVLLPASAGVVDPITLDSPIAEIGTMPLHIAFRGARGNEQLTARIRFAGFADPVAEASTTATNGFGVINLGFTSESAPPATDGPATLQILHADGTLAAEKQLRILGPNEVQYIKVGWFAGSDEIVLAQQAVGKTPRLAQAAIEELVQGPWEGNAAGFTTMLPTVEEIVNYPGRDASWGYRVRLIKVTITNGVATVNFGPELRAYGTSVVRAQQIRQQVEQTLRQFSSVKEVVIQINGDAGALPQ